MRKIKGVMINGEWLGERVIINGVFRAICNISPIIMLEFVKLINKLDSVYAPFTISSFEFSDTDGILIKFKNNDYKGSVELFFALERKQLKLRSSFLDIQPVSALEGISSKEALNENDCLSEAKIEKIESLSSETNLASVAEQSNLEEKVDIVASEESSNETSIEETMVDKTEVDSDVLTVVEEDIAVSSKDDSSVVENCNEAEEALSDIYANENSTRVAMEEQKVELLQKVAEHTSGIDAVSKPFVIEVVQQAPVPPVIEYVQSAAPVMPEEKKDEVVDKVLEKIEASERKIETEKDLHKEKSEENVESDLDLGFEFKKNEVSEKVLIEEARNEAKKKPSTKINDVFEEDDSDIFDDIRKLREEKSFISENDKFEDMDSITSEDSSEEELDDDALAACFSEFYAEKELSPSSHLEKILDNTVSVSNAPQDFMMQAVLAEMVALKEELDVLKAEPSKKLTAEEFFGPQESQYIKDEDADFRILSSSDKINAAILDEDCFLAGEKLYRWGETLYLED